MKPSTLHQAKDMPQREIRGSVVSSTDSDSTMIWPTGFHKLVIHKTIDIVPTAYKYCRLHRRRSVEAPVFSDKKIEACVQDIQNEHWYLMRPTSTKDLLFYVMSR